MKQIAIVTGASSGMGQAFFHRIDGMGFDEIWVIARRENRLRQLAEGARTAVKCLPLDLSKRESYTAFADELKREAPDVGLLVNASGFGQFGGIEKVNVEMTMDMIDVNCRALAVMTESTLPYMNRGAKIIQIGSLSSFQPVPYMITYAASKAFVLSYSRALNVELKGRGIHVMAVCPGWVRTEFFDMANISNTSKEVNYFDKWYTSEQVVDCAFIDLKKRKDLSVCGAGNRFQVFLVKLMPSRIVMRTWLKRQGHGRNRTPSKAK